MRIKFALDPAIKDHKPPARATSGSAGFDFFSPVHADLKPGAKMVIPSGVYVEIPSGMVGLIWPRSGKSVRFDQVILAGVIDDDYRKEIHIALKNLGHDTWEIRKGDGIAQMVVVPYLANSQVVDLSEIVPNGRGGFGSTVK